MQMENSRVNETIVRGLTGSPGSCSVTPFPQKRCRNGRRALGRRELPRYSITTIENTFGEEELARTIATSRRLFYCIVHCTFAVLP